MAQLDDHPPSPRPAHRANISKPMLETVNAEFEVYHAEAVALHLRHVDLPDQFESVIQDVEKSKLLASKAVEERKVKLLLESRKNQTKCVRVTGRVVGRARAALTTILSPAFAGSLRSLASATSRWW